MLWTCLRSSDVRQVDFGGCRTWKLNFRFFSCFLQALKRHWILAKIDLLFGLEFRSQPVDDHLVKVISTQVYVTVGGLHFKDTVSKFKDGNIKCSSAQVIDRNLHVYVFLVHAVSKGSSSRLVDDSLYFKAGNLTSLFGSLTLRIVEVCRYGDDRFGYCLSQEILCCALHFLKNHGR